jgi:hypothetical protein
MNNRRHDCVVGIWLGDISQFEIGGIEASLLNRLKDLAALRLKQT